MPIDIRVLTGAQFNLLETGTVTASPTPDPFFPVANLYDGRPSRPFREIYVAPVVGVQDDLNITVDGNRVANGSLDTWSVGSPVSWTEVNTGAGAVTETTVAGEFVVGSAAKLVSGVGETAEIYQDIVVRSGQKRRLDIQLRTSTGSVYVTVTNLRTHSTLQSNGTWLAGGAILFTATGAYAPYTVSYTVEPFSTSQHDLVPLRISVRTSGIATAFADECYDYPAIDFMSIHGHTLDARLGTDGMTIQLKSNTDNWTGVGTIEATATAAAQPAFYALLAAPIYRRFWRLRVLGNNSVTKEIGELVIGQTQAIAVPFDYGSEFGQVVDDVATETGLGEQHVYARTNHARRTLGLKFHFDSETRYREARDEVFRRSHGRVHPLVIVPDTALPDVIHGRIDRTWKVNRTLVGFYDQNDLKVLESAFPIATN